MRCNRRVRTLCVIAGIACCIGSVCANAADDNEIRVTVKREDLPSIHISGSITLPAGRSSGPSFDFTELKPDAIQRIVAFQGDHEIRVETRPFSKRDSREGTGCFLPTDTAGTVRIAYDVDPTFYPPASDRATAADARARVTGDLGVLRTTTILPQRIVAGAERIRFDLPGGWTAVTPWVEHDGAFVLGEGAGGMIPEYIGIGPISVTEFSADEILFRVGVCVGVEGMENTSLLRVLKIERDIAACAPGAPGDIFCVIVVPRGFIRGGSSGQFSAVQPPEAVTLAHEMFHWWNTSRLIKPDANWFHEGFTEYYGICAARDAGLIDAEFATACFADLNAEMRYLEGDKPVSLLDASALSQRDFKMRRIVYAKGALLALLMERELKVQGKTLNEAMASILALGRGNLSNDDLRGQFREVYGGAVDGMFNQYVLEANPLPDLELPAATGKTGVAKYLPGK
ncbi:MAG: hypothetical protein HUU46_21910 [Candidatus Hydrogenedentes bacterium]|nr:hypothetical protein [Candidatus Hydrogenedentota bacterium]